MSNVMLLHGDCLEVMPTLPAKSVQMIFSDLPYGILKHRKWDQVVNLRSFWNCAKRIRRDTSAVLFTANMLLAAKLIESNVKDFRYDLVWQKPYASNFLMSKKRPLCVHEHVLCFAKPRHFYQPQMRDESMRGKIFNTITKPTTVGTWHAGRYETRVVCKGPMHPISVLQYGERRQIRVHPTQKPVALIEWLIKTFTNPGDTVLDPVAGSGTTAIAAMRTGRRAICIEKDAGYFEVMSKRVAEERAKEGAA